MSVEHSPTRTTSAPWLVAPSPSASAIGAEDGRMSCPIASEPAPVSPMHARPMLRARSSSSCSGYSPRTSSALNTWSRSAGTGRLLGWTLLGTGRFASCRGPDRHGVPGDAKGALYSFGCARKRPAGPSRWRPGAHIVRWSVTIEEVPNGDEVPGEGIPLGLYQGIPLTERGSGYYGALPDRIVIFRRPIEARARSDAALASLVSEVVLNEVAHYFGIDDDRLDELGW